MSNTDINYKNFISFVHQNFEQGISLEEVEEILHLEEDYNKDSPASLGKSLVINRLIFSGKKISGEDFYYDQQLYTGVNVWIADNQKGKSTIFKIIKFALTGTENIKPDIKPWINEIILEFQIGNSVYTNYINWVNKAKGALYSFGIEKFLKFRENQKLNIFEKEKEFDFSSKNELEEKIQDFFFDHFSFYTLKYTQKNSSKEDFEINTANLSWSTYFKSIYLESNNYEYLFFDKETFGAQGRKIFEMILGLPLTYPINMLSIQRDKVSEDIGKLKLTDKSIKETSANKKEIINKRYAEVSKALEDLNKIGKIHFDEKPLIEEYNKLHTKINDNRKRARIISEEYQIEKEKLNTLEEELRFLEQDHVKVNEEIKRLTKQELNIGLYIDAESFFSNLDIKVCPHCEIEISENKKEQERKDHVCGLCGETPKQQKIDEAELQNKFSRIKDEKNGYSNKIALIQNNINLQKIKAENQRKLLAEVYSKLVSVPSDVTDMNRLKEIENQIETITNERDKQRHLLNKREDLIKEEAVLKFQLGEIAKERVTNNGLTLEKYFLKKEVLNFALKSLERKRISLNKEIISKLEELILKEIQAFGLSSINKIEINDKFDLIFTQNQVNVNFSELTEGEKLRAKLAFYLSLIQLDIEHNLGRHPRFLIFDAPGSEEMIEDHLHGLSEIFKNVNKRFSNKLQIFVGSAIREFSQITDVKKALVKGKNDFVF